MGVVLAAAVGVGLGGIGGYGIGHTAGHAVVVRYGGWLGITSARLDRAHRFFEKHGVGAVLIGRFVPVVRILTGIIAGITDDAIQAIRRLQLIGGDHLVACDWDRSDTYLAISVISKDDSGGRGW